MKIASLPKTFVVATALLSALVGCTKDESSTVAPAVAGGGSINPAKPDGQMSGAEAGLSPTFANAPKPGSALGSR